MSRPPIFIPGGLHDVMILDRHIKIGYKLLTIDEWRITTSYELKRSSDCVTDEDIELWYRFKQSILALATAAGQE